MIIFLFISIILILIIATLSSTPSTGINANPASTNNALYPSLIVFTIVYVVLYIAEILFILGLMFGIRDLRRSKLKSANVYLGVSHSLKIIVVGLVFVVIIAYILLFLSISSVLTSITTYNLTTGTTSTSPSSIFDILALIPVLVGVVLFIMGILKINEMYKALAADISQKGLQDAANLLLAAVGASILGFLIIVSSFLGGAYLLSAVGILFIIIGTLLLLGHFVVGYTSTKKVMLK